jgi:RHS repeat-associated protein
MPNPTLHSTFNPSPLVRFVVGLGLGACLLAQAPSSAQRLEVGPTRDVAGETRTLLADGSLLVTGGSGPSGVLDTVEVVESGSERRRQLPVRLGNPRTGHSATVLADGRVLLFGGLDSRGRFVSAAEVFDPESATITTVRAPFTARTAHTATVLSDGRVLVVGGRGAGADVAPPAELWDPGTDEVTSVPSRALPRAGHRATLLADGAVAIEGGTDPAGRPVQSELFFPEQPTFIAAPGFRETAADSTLAGSDPPDGAAEVPIMPTIVLRYSGPLMLGPELTRAFTLSAADGDVPVRVVATEGGRLFFVRPLKNLENDRSYTVRAGPFAAANGSDVRVATVSFTTEGVDDPTKSGATDRDEAPVPDDASGKGPSSWQKLPPLQAPPGVTALAGQILRLSGLPLSEVHVSLGKVRTVTDRTGRFLLPDVPAGRQELLVDSRPASTPRTTYGFFMIAVDVEGGGTTPLPFKIWLPALDTRNEIRLPRRNGKGAQDFVARTPRIPGLEVHIPAGGVLRDADGNIAKTMTITPIPIDRPPFPLPTGVRFPVYFTLQPGGARLEGTADAMARGIRLVFPNTAGLKPGTRIDYWSYDSKETGWFRYGQGTVGRDGRTVSPDPGVVIRHFTCASIGNPSNFPGTGPPPGGDKEDSDPVDLATGLFVYEKTDAFLPDVIPIGLTRTYRPNDPVSRPFGRGATHSYELHLVGDRVAYTYAELVLPDGGRIRYDRTSPGTSHTDAVMEATATPTAFIKSVLSWNSQHSGWDLRLKEGTILQFLVDWVPEVVVLKAVQDRYGNRLAITRDVNRRVTQVWSQQGRTLDFSYDASNRVTQIRDNIGRTASYQYDASGRLWKVTDVAGGVTEFTYDASHRMLTVKDPRGIVYLTNVYDANGRVSEQTLADGGAYEFAYTLDVNNRVVQTDVTNPRGFGRRVTFNATGFALTDTMALGQPEQQSTSYVRHSPSNRVTSVTDALSRQTTFGYDSVGNLTSVTRLAGTGSAVTTTWTYEPAFQQVATITDPLNHTTSFAYDALGRLTTITDPLSHQTTFTYNAAGQPLTVTDPLSKTTTFAYATGNLVSITSPLGGVASRFVDAVGRVVSSTAPTGATATFAYNAFDLLTSIIDPLAGTIAFTYDGNGNLLTLTDARGKTTTWTYDSMDRVATRSDPLTRAESFAYDLNWNLVSWTDRKSQATTYQYDALDRQTLAGFGTTGTPPTYASTITTTYDAGNRATAIADSVSGTIGRTFDLLDRLTEETTPEGTVNYTYDTAGRRATMQVGGQTQVSYTYDDADRPTGVTQGAASVALAYDNGNRRTSLTLPNGIVVEYGYDDDSRLTGLTYKLGMSTLGTLTYGYDAASQRTTVGGTWTRTGLPAALTSAVYDNANQIATFGGVSYTYDGNGNLTSDGSRSYTWDARNQLASLTGPVSGSFAYDGIGRRRSKTIGGTTTQFLYDGVNPVQELSGGTPTANLLTGLGIDEYFARTDAVGVRSYLADALGSTVALADGSGVVQTEYSYEAFGETTATGVPTNNAFGFTGREADGTGLYFYRARYLHVGLRRFVSEDPLDIAGGDVNLYTYAHNDPTNLTDPLGECWFCPVLAGVPKWMNAGPRSAGRAWVPREAQPWPRTTIPEVREVARPGPSVGDLTKPPGPLPPWEQAVRDLKGGNLDDTAAGPNSPNNPAWPGGWPGFPGLPGIPVPGTPRHGVPGNGRSDGAGGNPLPGRKSVPDCGTPAAAASWACWT